MLSFYDRGSKEAKRVVHQAGGYVSFRPTDAEKYINVRVVSSYKHMGCIVQTSASVSGEIANRSAQVLSTCTNLRTKVFRCPNLGSEIKVQLVQSLLFSRFFYNAQLWYNMNAR